MERKNTVMIKNSGWKVLAIGLFLLMGQGQLLRAQDSIRVMTYNLLFYGVPSFSTSCTPVGVTARNVFFSPIINELRPDIFGVNEIAPTNAANSPAANILLNVLQPINPAYKRANVLFNASSNPAFANAMFYNSDKVELKNQALISHPFRPMDYYRFYYQGPGLAVGDTNWVEVILAHFSAGDAGVQVSQAQTALAYLDALGRPGNFIMMGDLNLSSSNSNAFQTMSTHSNADTKMNDPVNVTGNWSNNSASHVWSQSTRASSGSDCGVGGGLDDRFDLIACSNSLMNSNSLVHYNTGSYWVPGNPNAPNRVVSNSAASSMVALSDHYPVMMTLGVDRTVARETPVIEADALQIMGNPASGMLHLRVGTGGGLPEGGRLQLIDLQGRILIEKDLLPNQAGTQVDLAIETLADGMYGLRLLQPGLVPVVKRVMVMN